jgi:hypothetical protein
LQTLWVEIGAAFLIGLALRFVVNLRSRATAAKHRALRHMNCANS